MELIYDRPASRGVENALKRARQLCDGIIYEKVEV